MITMALYENRSCNPTLIHVENLNEAIDMKDSFFFGRTLSNEERRHTVTSPWMNRRALGDGYILIPNVSKGVSSDLEEITNGKFCVCKITDDAYVSMSKDDIEEIKRILDHILSPEGREQYEEERQKKHFYAMMFQNYRMLYANQSDEHIKRLRDALQNDIDSCRKWVDAMYSDDDSVLDELDPDFVSFLLKMEILAMSFSEAMWELKRIRIKRDTLTLKNAMTDQELIKQLIRALDPEAIEIIRMACAKQTMPM